MSTLYKGNLAPSDFKMWDGATGTFSRDTDTGGTETLNRVAWSGVDILEVFGNKINRNLATVNSALERINSANKVAIWFSPGTWTITDNVTIPSNITMLIPPGAILSISSSKTITINGLVGCGEYQVFSGSGSVSFGSQSNKDVHLTWFGFSSSATAANNDTYFANAVASMASGQKLIIPPGTTEIENVVFNPADECSLFAYGELESSATGVAFTIGNSSGSDRVYRYNIQNLKVESSSVDHTADRVGVLIRNVYESSIDLRKVIGFESGVKLFGDGTGCVYNEIHLGKISNNKYSVYLTADSNGWANENNYYGGKLTWTSGRDTAGFRHIWIDYYATYEINNNRFYSPSLESNESTGLDTAIGIYCEGQYNTFYTPRFELHSTNKQAEFTSNAERNQIFYGRGLLGRYDTDITDNGKRNCVYGTNSVNIFGGHASSDVGVLALQNYTTETTAPVISIQGLDSAYNGKWFGDGSILALKLSVGTNQVVGAQQTGVEAMTNLTAPANLDANTVTTAELADIVGNLINKLRSHGLVAD